MVIHTYYLSEHGRRRTNEITFDRREADRRACGMRSPIAERHKGMPVDYSTTTLSKRGLHVR